jgi:hypothetical protein
MLPTASLAFLNSSLWLKWEIAVPGGIILGEGGEMNSIGISRLYHG